MEISTWVKGVFLRTEKFWPVHMAQVYTVSDGQLKLNDKFSAVSPNGGLGAEPPEKMKFKIQNKIKLKI